MTIDGKPGQEFNPGDRVEWNTPQGKTTGVVKRKLTERTTISEHTVAASPEHPQYLVESDTSGKPAAHKPDALKAVGR